jgi:hypothetical protein
VDDGTTVFKQYHHFSQKNREVGAKEGICRPEATIPAQANIFVSEHN